MAYTTALWLTATLFPLSVAAAEHVDHFELSPEQLFDATVISASKTSEKLWDAPAAIYVLTNEDILRSGATSIPEALRLVPGVQVARTNTNSWAISVRGFNNNLANKLLVLMDGREVYNPLFSGVHWDVQDTALEDIDRIEVIRGPGATLWGANAVNGVINILTKKAADTQGNLVSTIAGNQERGIVTARHGGKMENGGHYRIYGKYLNRDEQERPNGSGAEDEWKAWRGGFRADWENMDTEDAFTLQGDSYNSKADHFVSIPLLISPFVRVEEETVSARGWNLLGRWDRDLPQGAHFTLQSYLDYTLRDQELLNEEHVSFDLDGQYAFAPGERHAMIIGARYRLTQDELEGAPHIVFRPDSRSDNLFSGFIQDKITLQPETWYLTLGSKFEHNEYSGFEVQPNARLQWHPNDHQMLWASISRAVRVPSRLEHDGDLALATIPPGTLPLPVSVALQNNSRFDSEELIAYELGYRHQWTPALSGDIAAFYNDYDRLATNTLLPPVLISNGIDPLHLLLPVAATNATTAETYGFEVATNWRAHTTLNLSATYSLLDMKLHGPPSNIAIASEAAETQAPHHQFTLRSQWDMRPNMTLDTLVYYVDALPAFQLEDRWHLDMRWGWLIRDGLEFNLVGQNLFHTAQREFSAPTAINATRIQPSIYGQILWRF